jgi:hypothetical protein
MGRAELWAALACVALAVGACAAGRDPLPVVPHLGQLQPAPDRAGPRIGVAPFADLRSRLSRNPQRPRLDLVLLGVRREGENSTGDSSFVGDLARGAQLDAASTLAYSGLFGEVRLLESDRLPDDLDYVLVGEIEEFVGFQYQRSELSLLRAAGFHAHFDAPIGTTRLRFRLVGRDGEVWRDRIETRLQASAAGMSMERAALDALAVTHERLVVVLYRKLAASSRATRELAVRVLDACGLGARQARRLIVDASDIFELEAGIRLQPSIETWVLPGARSDAEDVLQALGSEPPPPGGVVLAFAPFEHGVSKALARQRTGLSRQLGRHAAVACTPLVPRTTTVAHEIAHLLGAIHSRQRGSVMYPVADFDARFFDATNRRILDAVRMRDFDAPLGALSETLRELYAAAAQDPEIEAKDLKEAEKALH